MTDIIFNAVGFLAVVGMVVAIGGMLSTFPLTRQQRRISKLEAERKEKWLREDLLKEDLLLKRLQDGFTHSAMTYNTDGTGLQPEKKAMHKYKHWLRVVDRK